MALTKQEVLQMDLKTIFVAVKDSKTASEMQALLKDRQIASRVSELMLEAQNREAEVDAQLARAVPPSTEQLAAEAAAMVAESAATESVVEVPPAPVASVTPPVPAVNPHEAEDAELKDAGVTVVRDASGKATRFIEEYQVRDEDGNPIGRPTHLEGRTLAELINKKRDAHENATRAFHRLKKQKLSFKNSEPQHLLTPEEITAAAEKALQEKDSKKVQDVIREIIRTEFGKQELTLQEQKDFQRGVGVGNQFKANHLYDYNPCEANGKLLGDYLASHEMNFTLDNLEAAFQDLKEQGDKLVPVAKHWTEKQVTVAANPAPVAAVTASAPPAIPVAEPTVTVPPSAPPAQPVAPSQPVVEATAPTPAAAPNVQPAARRPGVNGSLPPGTLSAQRPGTPDPALARKEFLKTVRDMKPEVMKTKLKNDPQFVKQLESYGIRVR